MVTVYAMKVSLGPTAPQLRVQVSARTRDTVQMEYASVKKASLEKTAQRVGSIWYRIKFQIYYIRTHRRTYIYAYVHIYGYVYR